MDKALSAEGDLMFNMAIFLSQVSFGNERVHASVQASGATMAA
jgi:hypothetical protein